MILTKRKGARSIKDIPKEIQDQLNRGEIETANLVEWLAVDQKMLLTHLLKQSGREIFLDLILYKIDILKKQTVNTINEANGTGIFEQASQKRDEAFF